MKQVFYVVLFAILFVSCKEKVDVRKQVYVNKVAVVDGVIDPLNTIEWLEDKYGDYQQMKDDYVLLVQYSVGEDQKILEFMYNTIQLFTVKGEEHIPEGANGNISSVSPETSISMRNIVDEWLKKIGSSDGVVAEESASSAAGYDEEVDKVLEGVDEDDIEILYCHRVVEVIIE